MKIVKLLKDYSKTPLEQGLSELLSNRVDSQICYEPIKNRKYIIEYNKPLHDVVIYTTAVFNNLVNRVAN